MSLLGRDNKGAVLRSQRFLSLLKLGLQVPWAAVQVPFEKKSVSPMSGMKICQLPAAAREVHVC